MEVIWNVEIVGLNHTCGIEDAQIFLFYLILCRSRSYDAPISD